METSYAATLYFFALLLEFSVGISNVFRLINFKVEAKFLNSLHLFALSKLRNGENTAAAGILIFTDGLNEPLIGSFEFLELELDSKG